jgi:alkylhydroperoxidase family enzyme
MGAVATTFPSGEAGGCLVPPTKPSPDLERDVRRKVGAVPGWLARFAHAPWVARSVAAMIDRPLAYAPAALCDAVGLVVSQENSCRYCYGAQRAVLRIYGYSEQYIDRLIRDSQVADLSAAERAAIDFARRLSRANPRPGPGEYAAVIAAGLDPMAAAEIAVVTSWVNFTNRVATFLALPPESLEAMVEHPFFRFVRPFVAWRMRPRQKAPQEAPQPNGGPCARLVAALDGSPSAQALRETLDEASASTILPLRTKMLILAVVARALGCRHGEEEARALLAQDGFGTADVDEVLATLGSSKLDAHERRLVPFARETVRYQAAAIQTRVRDVVDGFTPPEVVEAIGALALANAVCRLSVVLDAC